jgi:hypothetical protein
MHLHFGFPFCLFNAKDGPVSIFYSILVLPVKAILSTYISVLS